MFLQLMTWWRSKSEGARLGARKWGTRLTLEQLESLSMPAIINVGAAAPAFGSVYDDGMLGSVTQLANGEFFAADLSDAIGLVNTLPPQGGLGAGPADPVGPHLISRINVENIFLTRRLPTLIPQATISGNSAVTTVTVPEDYYPSRPTFAPTPVVTKAVVRRGDVFGEDQQGNQVGDFRILDAASSYLELKNLALVDGRETQADVEQHRHGGIIQFNGLNAPLLVDSCILRGGYAVGNGGAIYSATRGVTITNSLIDHNDAENGGAIYMFTASAQPLTITGTRLDGNYSRGNGGTIWADTLGVVNINRSGITDTAAFGGYGGALYVANAYSVDINRTFTDDTTAIQGGALYISSTLYLTINSSFITNCYNWSFDFDAIYARVRISYSISNSDIDGAVVIVS